MNYAKRLVRGMRHGEKGFTLIELLIVIGILGVIAAVVILNVGGFRGTGAKQAALIEKDAVQTAVLAGMIDGDCSQITGEAITTDGTADAPKDVTVTCADASTFTLEDYLQGAIDGGWTVDASGQITDGTYTSGGKICTWAGATGTMTCADVE